MDLSTGRRARAAWVLVLGSTLLALVASEVVLRVIGWGPWAPFEALSDAPVMSVADAELGWRPAPGTYRWRPDPDGPPVTLTTGADGGRGPVPARPAEVRLFGGSFVQGFGVHDDAHVGAHLDEALPQVAVRSYGVAGFGTLQAQLWSRRVIGDEPPGTLVYGLNDLHDARNACLYSWLRGLDRAGAHHPHVRCPYAVVSGSELRVYPPRTYRHWALSERLALVHVFEGAVVSVRDRAYRTKSETTVRLIAAWRDRVEARGGRLIVALLWAPRREGFYLRRLAELGVEVVDLRGAGFPDAPGSRVPVDGHPSAEVHAAWAEGLAAALVEGAP